MSPELDKCPHCNSTHISFDVLPVDHENLEHAEILAEYYFCWDCRFTWFDYDEINEKIKELHSLYKLVLKGDGKEDD